MTWLAPKLPRKGLLRVFGFLGRLAFRALKKEREKTLSNLRIAFGEEKSEDELKSIGSKVFENQAKNLADYAHTINVTTRKDFEKFVTVSGEEHLKKAYEDGKGVLCLLCHVGSWEFSAITPSLLGYRTTAVSKALKDPKMNELIVGYRQKRGLNNLNRGNTYDQLVNSLNAGECMIIMIDQDTRVKSTFVDFFGKPAYTPVGAAMLALDTEAQVLPMAMHRLPNDKHQFTIMPPLPLTRSGNRTADLIANTQIYSEAIEKFVRKDPAQWVWMHRRWKTTPERAKRLVDSGVIRDPSILNLNNFKDYSPS